MRTMTRLGWSGAALMAVLSATGGCEEGGLEVGVSVQRAMFSTCNGIIAGLDLGLSVDNRSDARLVVGEIWLNAADGSVVGSTRELEGFPLTGGVTADIPLSPDSCVDPDLPLRAPTQPEVELVIKVQVRDPESGETGIVSATTQMLFIPGWDNCATGYGSPGEGCGTWGPDPYSPE